MKRFWDKVDKSEQCWLWLGSKTPDGYGRTWLNGKGEYAHRLSYMLHFGIIESGLYVLHTCDNPACVNPSHLRLGTAKQNTHDMLEKGRRPHKYKTGNR